MIETGFFGLFQGFVTFTAHKKIIQISNWEFEKAKCHPWNMLVCSLETTTPKKNILNISQEIFAIWVDSDHEKVFPDDANSKTYPISIFPLRNFSTEEADFSKKDFKVCSFVCKMDQQNRPVWRMKKVKARGFPKKLILRLKASQNVTL